MNNCLVTKLKAEVNNPNLPILKEFVELVNKDITYSYDIDVSDLVEGTKVYVRVTNTYGSNYYLDSKQYDVNGTVLKTIIPGMQFQADQNQEATTELVSGCTRITVTIDTNMSAHILVGYFE